MLIPLGHASHWAIYIFYAVPVVVVLVSVLVTIRRERRQAADDVRLNRSPDP